MWQKKSKCNKSELLSNKKFLITGGHMTPALSVLDYIFEKNLLDKRNIVWVGHKHSQTGDNSLSAEFKEVSQREIKFIHLKTGKIWRKWTMASFFKGLKNLFLIPFGFFDAFYIIIKERPNIIISFGGYLSVPIIINAWILKPFIKTKIYLHIQPVTIDLSTKVNKYFVDRIFLSWTETKKYFPKKFKNKLIITGNPIRKEFLSNKKKTKKIFSNDLPIILIMGGNQGANTFNRRLRGDILVQYLKQTNLIHQTGASTITNDYQKAQKEYKNLPAKLQKRYKIYKFIDAKTLNEIYEQTTLILSRSGANSVTEILYKQIPTIFMPLPWAVNNEQLKNALIAKNTGLATIYRFKERLEAEELYEEVIKALNQTYNKKSFKKSISWTQAKKRARSLVNPKATSKIVSFIFWDLV